MGWSEILGDTPPVNAAKKGSEITHSAASSLTSFSMPSKEKLMEGAAAAGGAYLGHRYWKKHPWLGAVTGASVGFAALPIAKDEDRKGHIKYVTAAAGAYAGATYGPLKKNPLVGWLVGGIVGGVIGRYAASKL